MPILLPNIFPKVCLKTFSGTKVPFICSLLEVKHMYLAKKFIIDIRWVEYVYNLYLGLLSKVVWMEKVGFYVESCMAKLKLSIQS